MELRRDLISRGFTFETVKGRYFIKHRKKRRKALIKQSVKLALTTLPEDTTTDEIFITTEVKIYYPQGYPTDRAPDQDEITTVIYFKRS